MQRSITRRPGEDSTYLKVVDYLKATGGIALDTSLSVAARTVSVPSSTSITNVSILHLDLAKIPYSYGDEVIRPETDGTITVLKDVKALTITAMAICRFASSDNVVIGIGIGDPTTLPTAPGASTATLPDGTYVSRFRDPRRGEGNSRSVTFTLPYFPVGKQFQLGAKAGDKIFPVIWTEEQDSASVIFDDFTFVVQVPPQ